jgi:GT2 family glycosyltransferase
MASVPTPPGPRVHPISPIPGIAESRVAVVIATRNRCEHLLGTLARLQELPERPRVVVVDNGSTDDTVAAVTHRHPDVEVVALARNQGAVARNVGVGLCDTHYVAFSDDDSWWAPGSLSRAADLFDTHARLALVAARVLVGSECRIDPVCVAMRASPVPRSSDLPGQDVLGFVACGAVVRRTAFCHAGGFHARFGIGGEEELLAIDLASTGWGLAYVDDVVAHHHPAPARNPAARRRIQLRNALWVAWLRRPALRALVRSAQVAWPARKDSTARLGAIDALMGVPWVLEERRSIPLQVERALRMLER